MTQRQPTPRLRAQSAVRQTLSALALATAFAAAPLAASSAWAQSESAAAADTAPLATYDAGTVLAQVGGQTITLADLIVARSELPQEYQSAPDDVLFSQLLQLLIRDAVLAEQATMDGLQNDPRVAAQMRFSQRSVLARAYAAKDAEDTSLADSIDSATVRARYDEEVAGIGPVEEVRARHILVESEEAAQAIKAELDAGADFVELAKEKSTGPSGPNGGDLGFFQKGQMVPAFEAVAFEMEPGDISEPVQSDFGWHVIKLEERRSTQPPTPPFEQVEELLKRQMVEEARQERMEALGETLGLSRAEALPPASAIREDALLDAQ